MALDLVYFALEKKATIAILKRMWGEGGEDRTRCSEDGSRL